MLIISMFTSRSHPDGAMGPRPVTPRFLDLRHTNIHWGHLSSMMSKQLRCSSNSDSRTYKRIQPPVEFACFIKSKYYVYVQGSPQLSLGQRPGKPRNLIRGRSGLCGISPACMCFAFFLLPSLPVAKRLLSVFGSFSIGPGKLCRPTGFRKGWARRPRPTGSQQRPGDRVASYIVDGNESHFGWLFFRMRESLPSFYLVPGCLKAVLLQFSSGCLGSRRVGHAA